MIRLIQRIAIPTGILIWATIYFIEILGRRPSAQLMIRPAFFILVVLFIIITVTDVRDWIKENAALKKASEKGEEVAVSKEGLESFLLMVVCAGSAFAYMFAMSIIGFSLSTAAYLFGMLCYLKVKNKIYAMVISVLLTGALYMLFRIWLRVPLPAGFLGFFGF